VRKWLRWSVPVVAGALCAGIAPGAWAAYAAANARAPAAAAVEAVPCTSEFTGAASSSWANPANWAARKVPGADD
jgi:hypothetical protein